MSRTDEYVLFGPCGHEITATIGLVSTVDGIREVWPDEENGGFAFEYDDQGSDVIWDTAEALKRDGQEIFMCGAGDESPRNKLELRKLDEETGEYVAVTQKLGL